MSRNQKFNVHFFLNKRRKKDGKTQLYIRIFIDQKRAEIATTYYVPISSWNENKREVKNSYAKATFINGYINRTINEITQIFIKESSQRDAISSVELKDIYLGKQNGEIQLKTILEAFNYHNTRMEEEVKIGKVVKKTHARYIITKNKVRSFMKKQYKVKDMPLPDLRLRFVTEFEHYLLTKENLQVNTAHKYIKNLKKIMNMAVGLDWIPSNPFNNFRCSYTPPKREVLTQEELNKLMSKKISIERLEEVRDVFIFCCYTGFSYSDIHNFEYDAVTTGIDGEAWLSTERQKTGTKESVPLLPVALEIINKYRENEHCISSNKLLPVNSNQCYNAYLKELADICGIEKRITSHIARHTFATTVTLANGVPIETVSKMLGHSSIRTTQVYAKVIEQKVSEDMLNLKDKLFGEKAEPPKKDNQKSITG
ncbi:site-specific integrase [Brumimicrobium aurantiacum]|uniref:Site-specific integrase n=1 Tax=Brumimicrobium aurantiacum TaxID=1737063 RepID=A0A3E1EUG2_9FLAO|nr:site-specific integrase [Brumimicrobium aurantiacum]RFC53197.1 site-specific integrase [Brumimicrobium aurantiacum]